MKQRITLREISELTGLSTFSVSQALNGEKGFLLRHEKKF